MDPVKFKDKNPKVSGTTEVAIFKIKYKDPNYKIKLLPYKFATGTALVKVAKLIPDVPKKPTFVFRWDEKANALDVDMYKEGKKCKSTAWTHQRNGYKGHHTTRVYGYKRLFKAEINIPERKIFKGIINVGLFIEEAMKAQARAKTTLSLRIFRAKKREA